MKGLKLFFAGLSLVALTCLPSLTANAQESNRDENGKIVRGPYETNGFGDNWFVSVGGGINYFVDGINSSEFRGKISPAVDFNFGKWFTPCVGARIGYKGLNLQGWSDHVNSIAPASAADGSRTWTDGIVYKEKANMGLVHADIMWNISNAIGGYKPERFWNFIPYASAGVVCAFGTKDYDYVNHEATLGAGLLNNIRLCDRVDLTLDIAGHLVAARLLEGKRAAGIASATLGLSVDLGKNSWVRGCSEAYAAALAANAAAAAANKALEDQNNALAKENEILRNTPVKTIDNTKYVEKLNVSADTFYFEIGKTKLSAKEAEHLNFYVKNVVEQAPAGTTFTVTGYADKSTGTKYVNEKIAQKRAETVANVIKAAGAEVNVVNGGAVAGGKAAMLRSAVVEF